MIKLPSYHDRILKKLVEIKLFLEYQVAANGHYDSYRSVDFVLGPLLTRVDILLCVVMTDDIADHPGKNRIAVVNNFLSAYSTPFYMIIKK